MTRFLVRASEFSYACNGCGRCCHDKRITLTPYELERLARALGTTTRDVLENGTAEGGTALRFDAETHACVYLDGTRCSVHSGRPLACRIYPIGRVMSRGGEESFLELVPHPETAGVYGTAGTIGAWLEAQGAAPYIAAAAKYEAIFRRMVTMLEKAELEEAMTSDEVVVSDWLDVDAVVSRACAARGVPEPTDAEERIAIHLAELGAWVDGLGSGRISRTL